MEEEGGDVLAGELESSPARRRTPWRITLRAADASGLCSRLQLFAVRLGDFVVIGIVR